MNLTPSLDYVLSNLVYSADGPKYKLKKKESDMQVDWESKDQIKYFKGNPKKAERLYLPEEKPHLIRAHFYKKQFRCKAVMTAGILDTTVCPMCVDVENNYKDNTDGYYQHRRQERYLVNALRYTDTDDRGHVRGNGPPSVEVVLWSVSSTVRKQIQDILSVYSSYATYDFLVNTEIRKVGDRDFPMQKILPDREAVLRRNPEHLRQALDVYNKEKYDIEKVFAPEVPDVDMARAIELAHKFAANSARSKKLDGTKNSHSETSFSQGDAVSGPNVVTLDQILKS